MTPSELTPSEVTPSLPTPSPPKPSGEFNLNPVTIWLQWRLFIIIQMKSNHEKSIIIFCIYYLISCRL